MKLRLRILDRARDRVRDFLDTAAECARLRDRNEVLAEQLDKALIAKAWLKTCAEELETDISQWRAKTRLLEQQLVESYDSLEQANSRIAMLQQQLRDAGTDEQLDLMHPPAAATPEEGSVDDVVVQDVTREEIYRLVGIFFEGKHWWELALGENRIKAPIHDKLFLDEITARKVFFASGDAIRMQLRTVTYQKPSGDLYAKFFVERVLGVISPDKQLSFEPPAAPPPPELAEGARS